MAFSYVSDNEIDADISSVSAAVLSKLAYNNEATAAGDPGAPRLQLAAMPAPTAGNAVIRYWRGTNQVTTTYSVQAAFPVVRTGTYRTQLYINNMSSSRTVYARIYRNGTAYGTERTISPNTSATYTQDLSFTAADQIQLYLRGSDTTSPEYEIKIGTAHPLRPIAKRL